MSWFQTLEPIALESFEKLTELFIKAFSKTGTKHNAVSLVYSFKQKENETVRDCVNRLTKYIHKCPINEKPQPQRLIFVFLEGLHNKQLHDHLYAKRHTTFSECCLDAMEFDDNFACVEKDKPLVLTEEVN